MNNRLDQQMERSYLAELTSLMRDVDELKTRQPTSSKLVKRAYIYQSSKDFDLLNYSIPANTVMSLTFVVTTDGSQANPWGIQYSAIYNNGTDAAHRLSDYQLRDSTGTGYNWLPNADWRTPGDMAWDIVIQTGGTAASISIKLRAMTTAKGVSLNLYG